MTNLQGEFAFPDIKISIVASNGNGKSSFCDPAFAGNKIMPVHRWVPWIAGFSCDFVGRALEKYLEKPGVVLDPFCGVGTTLVEALVQGHQSVGFEINPYAALAARAKLQAGRVSSSAFKKAIDRFCTFCDKHDGPDYTPKSLPPPGFRSRADFYSPNVMRKVLLVQDYIETLDNGEVRDLFRLAFASTMVRYSNYSYEPSLGRRVSSGKEEILDFPVAETVTNKLREMKEDIGWLKARASAVQDVGGKVINDSFFHYETHLSPGSVDFIITSPPYVNNYHYNRNTRPHLYWLGYVQQPKDLSQLENANFGKYWQTVREAEPIDLDFELPGENLHEQLVSLRALKPEKGIYGGKGWANYAASYFNDCYKFAQGIHYVLKPGRTALVVIGNSILQGLMIPTDRYFGKISELAGLELVEIHIPRSTRVGNSIIKSTVRVEKAQDTHQLYEAVIELRRR
jgi:DNA modification methylase